MWTFTSFSFYFLELVSVRTISLVPPFSFPLLQGSVLEINNHPLVSSSVHLGFKLTFSVGSHTRVSSLTLSNTHTHPHTLLFFQYPFSLMPSKNKYNHLYFFGIWIVPCFNAILLQPVLHCLFDPNSNDLSFSYQNFGFCFILHLFSSSR